MLKQRNVIVSGTIYMLILNLMPAKHFKEVGMFINSFN